MALSRKEKEQLVEDLSQLLHEQPALVVFSFQTLTVANSSALRRELRKSGGTLRVVKKRLFRRIAERVGLPAEKLGAVEGSVAIAWSADTIAPAKVTHAFVKEHKDARFEGGMLNGAVLAREDIERLALLPGESELRGQLVSVLAIPMRRVAGVLSSTLRGLPGILQALADKRGASPAA